MNERFKLVLVKLVCADIDAPNFARYDFKKIYLAVKDTKDEEQPYGIIGEEYYDIFKILIEIKRSNKIGTSIMGREVVWEFECDYKFEEIE